MFPGTEFFGGTRLASEYPLSSGSKKLRSRDGVSSDVESSSLYAIQNKNNFNCQCKIEKPIKVNVY